MKKKMINLKSLQETLNANELKNILGGSDGGSSGDGCFTVGSQCTWSDECCSDKCLGGSCVESGCKMYFCSCGTSWWTGIYCNQNDILDALESCEGNGSCSSL